MEKIVVYNNKIVINDYTFGDSPELEKCFEVYDKAGHYVKNVGAIYNDNNKTATLPRGMSIRKLETIFGTYAVYHDTTYNTPRFNAEQIMIRYAPKSDQIDAINFILGQGPYSDNKKYSQKLLALGTGMGKTYIGIAYIAFMNMKSIIITSSSEWLDQWKERIQEHTTLLKSQIRLIKGSFDIRSLMDKSQEWLDNKYSIYTITHSTILSYAKNNGWDSVNDLFIHLGIGVKIFDEAHLNFDNIYHIDYAVNVYKTIYLTATPSRGEPSQNRIFQTYFHAIPTLMIDNKPHTNYIALRYYSKFTAEEKSRCISAKFGFNKTKYCDILVQKENFDLLSRIIMDLVSKIDGKKLFFFATNNAIMSFYEWLNANYPEYHGKIGIFTSINSDKEEALHQEIILTTSKSAGAAVDCGDIMVSVNMAEPTKSKPMNKQRFGRTRAYNSYYIDVIDCSFNVCCGYYKTNLPMFEELALSVKEVFFNNDNLKKTAFEIMKKHNPDLDTTLIQKMQN